MLIFLINYLGINPALRSLPDEAVISYIINRMLDWNGLSSVEQLQAMAAIDVNSAKINSDGLFEVILNNVTGLGLKPNLPNAEIHRNLAQKSISLAPEGAILPYILSKVFIETPGGMSTLPNNRRS